MSTGYAVRRGPGGLAPFTLTIDVSWLNKVE